jgi:AmmeMemoRadiSam system protein A
MSESEQARQLLRLGPELPAVARRAISAHLQRAAPTARVAGAPAAPVFVTLRLLDGSLRGCVGSIAPREPDVVTETARSAVLAATRDPRFTPLGLEELSVVCIEVSVLMPELIVASAAELDPRRYGVIVRDALGRRGLLLPDIEGIDSAHEQLEIARRKAGIEPDAVVTLSRFEVLKFV